MRLVSKMLRNLVVFRFFWRNYRRLQALKAGGKYHLGDVVNVLGEYIGSVKHFEVAIMDRRFKYRNQYGDILNRFEYLVDVDNATWIPEKRIELVPEVIEPDQTVGN